MTDVFDTVKIRQEPSEWAKQTLASLCATCRGEESYDPGGLTEIAILSEEVEMLIYLYLDNIQRTRLQAFGYGLVGSSDMLRVVHVWKRIATFVHDEQISKYRLGKLFWRRIVDPVRSPDDADISVFRDMAEFLAEMGVAVEDCRSEHSHLIPAPLISGNEIED